MRKPKNNKGHIRKIFDKLIWSFDNTSSGFSARKLSAFVGIMTSIWITIEYTSGENLQNILGIWLVFALLCLGIITAEQIIRFRDGNEKNAEDDHGFEDVDGDGIPDKPKEDKPDKPADESADPVI